MYTFLENLDGLKNSNNLSKVSCLYSVLTDITGLKDKQKLNFVDLNMNRRLKDISILSTCTNLEQLYLSGCTGILDFSPLKAINLKRLACGWVNKESNIEDFDTWFTAKLGKVGTTLNLKTKKSVIAYGVIDHPVRKETLEEKSWDYEYRAKNVYGDDVKCDCNYCNYYYIDSYVWEHNPVMKLLYVKIK